MTLLAGFLRSLFIHRETLILENLARHRQGFKLYWRWTSRPKRLGRPTIPREHIEFIIRMSCDNPSWGEDKINEELRVKFGVSHSTSTIRKYMA